MNNTVNAAYAVPSPRSFIPFLLNSLSVQRSQDLIQQLLGAFYSFLKVTRKILQRNYLEKHLKLCLEMAHSGFITKKIMMRYKTNNTEWDYNYRRIAHQVLVLCLDDAVRDLEWSKKLARNRSKGKEHHV